MSIKIQKNISLSKYTSFKIGGPAKYFCAAENNDEIKEALKFAEKNKLKVFVLGGGSNLLISDKGFDGIVIKIQDTRYKIQDTNIICGGGLPLAKLVSESVKNNLTGFEWAAGIPGTVGGAVVNNAGANGSSMSDVVDEVEILEIPLLPSLTSPKKGGTIGIPHLASPKRGGTNVPPLKREGLVLPLLGGVRGGIKLANKQCQFSYRDSVFKKDKRFIILSVVLKLKKGNQDESEKTILKILKSRKEKQPLEYPSAGSIFKNPVVDDSHLTKLIKEYPELKTIAKNNTIPAGWLIENSELKSKKIGGAMISEKHCNFIINFNNAKAEDVIILISLIKQKMRMRFGIQLKEEIEYVGF